MPGSAEEATFAKTPLGSDLEAGVDSLDLNESVTFTQYVRLVLPLDGFVFWVRPQLVTPSALLNVARVNGVRPNQFPSVGGAPTTAVIKGSLHYVADVRQEADETYTANRVVFTAEQSVNNLNNIAPGTLWIGRIDGQIGSRQFAFSSNSSRYQQSGLWHYHGFAVYPDMETQIVDSLIGFDRSLVVSNSLPAWLALNGYFPGYGFGNPGLTFYPSFLVPENLAPPYVAVDVQPEGTRALAMAPTIGPTSTHEQLCSDRVRLTLWGTRNFNAMDLVDCVNQYSSDVGVIGIMGDLAAMRDEKRTQAELATIAMKKTIDFEVSYLQNRMNDLGRGLIKSSLVAFEFSNAA